MDTRVGGRATAASPGREVSEMTVRYDPREDWAREDAEDQSATEDA